MKPLQNMVARMLAALMLLLINLVLACSETAPGKAFTRDTLEIKLHFPEICEEAGSKPAFCNESLTLGLMTNLGDLDRNGEEDIWEETVMLTRDGLLATASVTNVPTSELQVIPLTVIYPAMPEGWQIQHVSGSAAPQPFEFFPTGEDKDGEKVDKGLNLRIGIGSGSSTDTSPTTSDTAGTVSDSMTGTGTQGTGTDTDGTGTGGMTDTDSQGTDSGTTQGTMGTGGMTDGTGTGTTGGTGGNTDGTGTMGTGGMTDGTGTGTTGGTGGTTDTDGTGTTDGMTDTDTDGGTTGGVMVDPFIPCHRPKGAMNDNTPGNGVEVFGLNRLQISTSIQIGRLMGDQCLPLDELQIKSVECTLSGSLLQNGIFSHVPPIVTFEKPELLAPNQILEGTISCTSQGGYNGAFVLQVQAKNDNVAYKPDDPQLPFLWKAISKSLPKLWIQG